MSSLEYRANGAACFLAAANSASSDKRAHWLMMAYAWIKLAEDVEGIARRASAADPVLRTDLIN
jgi:hypothetical protein